MSAGKSSSTLVKSRAAAFERQGGLCYYCELPMWLDDCESFRARFPLPMRAVHARRCTAEHLLARCDGGTNAADNIVAACFACNAGRHRRKVAHDPGKHRTHVRRRMALGRWHQPLVMRALHASGVSRAGGVAIWGAALGQGPYEVAKMKLALDPARRARRRSSGQ